MATNGCLSTHKHIHIPKRYKSYPFHREDTARNNATEAKFLSFSLPATNFTQLYVKFIQL